jgi:microcystin-dependent protein
MSSQYIGEIRMFGGNFAPAGWAFCDGRLLSIAEHDALFALIGTTYGGDGQSTFGLPDLRGRLPIHQGTGPGGESHVMGQSGGSETVTLTISQLPSHGHSMAGVATAGNQSSPQGHLPANTLGIAPYINDPPDGNMSAQAIHSSGGGQPHENMQPFLPISFIIALFGVFPSQD